MSTVYGPTGAVVAHLSGWISAFSSDDSLAVVGGWTGPVNLIRLSDQSTLWKGPDGIGYGYWQGVAEPGGTRIALGLRDPAFPQTTGFAPVDLYVLSASGQVLLEKRNVYLFTRVSYPRPILGSTAFSPDYQTYIKQVVYKQALADLQAASDAQQHERVAV
jgi:hypothetical protein